MTPDTQPGERPRLDAGSRWLAAAVLSALVGYLGVIPPTAVVVGVGGAAAILLARLLLSAPYVVATAGVAVGAVTSGTESTVLTVAGMALVVGLVALPGGWSRRGGRRTLGAAIALLLLAVAGTAAWVVSAAVWTAAIAVLGTGGLILYALHRYEQVQLGVVQRGAG